VEQPNNNLGPAVSGITIVELLRQYGYSSIDIVKMDIEGAGREVFSADYYPWLVNTKILIVELHDHLKPGCSQAFNSAIAGLGFHRMQRGENTILINPTACSAFGGKSVTPDSIGN
jgi:Methyltransferase FkbM domain